MRVYLPATVATLAALARTGELGPAPLTGYAVTAALQETYADSDEEELEYLATTLAAEDSFRLVTQPQTAQAGDSANGAAPVARRVVVVVDLPDRQVTGFPEPLGAVEVADPVPHSAIAAFHLDDPDFALDPDDPDAAADQELLWYAAQELGDLVDP
jgi:hypothetical protein